jgi:hypothetical protein
MSQGPLYAAIRATEREQLLIQHRLGYPGAMPLLPDKLGAITAAVAVFDQTGIAYALIGGLAVGVRSGVPRATLDVDFAIPSGTDRRALAQRLAQATFTLKGEFAHSINFTHSSGEPMQLAFDPSFDAMITRAEAILFGAVSLRVVTKADLLAMKKQAAADPKRRRSKALRDQADIALLEGDVPTEDEGW